MIIFLTLRNFSRKHHPPLAAPATAGAAVLPAAGRVDAAEEEGAAAGGAEDVVDESGRRFYTMWNGPLPAREQAVAPVLYLKTSFA